MVYDETEKSYENNFTSWLNISEQFKFNHHNNNSSKIKNIRSTIPIIPIADLGDGSIPNGKYSKKEIELRNKLAAFFRLVDLFEWSQGIYNHITLKLPKEGNDEKSGVILMHPFGMLFHEVTASSLIQLDLYNGKILDNGSTNLKENKAGFALHSAVHKARPEIRCVLHLHTHVVSAISAMKCGLLPISQEAMLIGPVGYHDYNGIVSGEEEKQQIIDDLGDKNVLILRNHGFVACGKTVEDTLHLAFHLILACECQLHAMCAGIENLIIPNQLFIEKAYQAVRGEVENNKEKSQNNIGKFYEKENWSVGLMDWEAWMRVLDSAVSWANEKLN